MDAGQRVAFFFLCFSSEQWAWSFQTAACMAVLTMRHAMSQLLDDGLRQDVLMSALIQPPPNDEMLLPDQQRHNLARFFAALALQLPEPNDKEEQAVVDLFAIADEGIARIGGK